MTIEPPGRMDLESAVRDGIRDCIDYLNASSDSFALASLRKWARLLTDGENPKGWPVVFRGGRGLYGTLRTIYEAIAHAGTGGDALRGLYADFLDEAAGVLGRDALKTSARGYRELAGRWRALAEAVLPDEVDAFKKTRALLDEREAILKKKASDGLAAIAPLNDALHKLEHELNDAFPLDETATGHLLAEMQDRVAEIYSLEKSALTVLQEAAF
jgi:hypothetical protein